jgi:hypothetical protein
MRESLAMIWLMRLVVCVSTFCTYQRTRDHVFRAVVVTPQRVVAAPEVAFESRTRGRLASGDKRESGFRRRCDEAVAAAAWPERRSRAA